MLGSTKSPSVVVHPSTRAPSAGEENPFRALSAPQEGLRILILFFHRYTPEATPRKPSIAKTIDRSPEWAMDDRVDALITSTPPASSHRVGRARRIASHRFARQVRIVATRESRIPFARPPVALPPASRSHRARRLAASRAPLRDYLPLKRHARDAFVRSVERRRRELAPAIPRPR